VGATLGGGIGRLSGLHGLTLDSLLSVWIMLPNTTVVEASQKRNSELFWGIRGSGFNYGIVLNATYRVYDQVPQGMHLNAHFVFPISQVKSYYENLAKALETRPPQLSILSFFNFNPILNLVSDEGLNLQSYSAISGMDKITLADLLSIPHRRQS